MSVFRSSSGAEGSLRGWWQAGGVRRSSLKLQNESAVAYRNLVQGPRTTAYLADIARREAAQANANARAAAARANIEASVGRQQTRAQASYAGAALRESATRSGLIASAAASNFAAGLRASEGASQSGRLFTEFEAGLAQQRALRQRDLDRAVGQSAAGFGAAGIQSTGAIRDIERDAALRGAVAESAANTQRQSIINRGRDAITGAIASSVRSGGQLASGLVSSFGREASALASARTAFDSAERYKNTVADIQVSMVSGITPDQSGITVQGQTGLISYTSRGRRLF